MFAFSLGPVLAVTLQTDYYFGGKLRAAWGMASPSYAGCFLSLAIVLLSTVTLTLFSRRRKLGFWWILALSVELVGWWMMIKTFSRSGLLAAIVAVISIKLMLRRSSSALDLIKLSLLEVIPVAYDTLSSGFWRRVEIMVSGTDASTSHRWDIYRGALQMMYTSPVRGWGTGRSGKLFCDWFQTSAGSIETRSLVNSFFTLAVEHGIWAMMIPAVFAISVVLAGIKTAGTRRNSLYQEASALAAGGTIAWVGCNMFSTLYDSVLCDALILVFCSAPLLFNKRYMVDLLKVTGAAFLIFCIAIVSLLASIGRSTRSEHVRVFPLGDSGIKLVCNSHSDNTRVVLVDESLAGMRFAHALRIACELSSFVGQIQVIEKSLEPFPNVTPIKRVLLMGVRAHEFSRYQNSAEALTVVFPSAAGLEPSAFTRPSLNLDVYVQTHITTNAEAYWGELFKRSATNFSEVSYWTIESPKSLALMLRL